MAGVVRGEGSMDPKWRGATGQFIDAPEALAKLRRPAGGSAPRRRRRVPRLSPMNAKLLLKSLLIVVVLALLVVMGMNNTGRVDFALPPLLPRRVQLPAALMYFACFAVGFLTGTLLWAGGGKKGGGSARSSADRK